LATGSHDGAIKLWRASTKMPAITMNINGPFDSSVQ
jgi:hypothetical protein